MEISQWLLIAVGVGMIVGLTTWALKKFAHHRNLNPQSEDNGLYCPKCRSKYRGGFSRCADCDLSLVVELPPAPHKKEIDVELEELIATTDVGQVALIKSLLESEKIPYVAQGDHIFTLAKVPGMPVRFLVHKQDMERARELLEGL